MRTQLTPLHFRPFRPARRPPLWTATATAAAVLLTAVAGCTTTQPKGTVTIQGRGSQVLTDKGDPLLGEGVESRRVSKDFAAGYAKGISDNVKRGYWARADAQQSVGTDEGRQVYYDATVPEHKDRFGVRRVEREVIVPIVE